LTLVLGLWSCNNKTNDHSGSKSLDILDTDMRQDSEKLTLQEKQSRINNSEIETSKDSAVFFSDSLFANLELELKEVSKNIFQGYEINYKPTCGLDSNGFIKGKGLILSHYCKDICESYLTDKKKGIKLVLPSNYDAGIMDLLFSPSCNQFLVYSSYDGPDYTNYYEYRAEIIGFTITQGQGFDAVKPSFKYYTKDWSIDHVMWVDENTLTLKLYNGERTGNGENSKYRYFKTNLKAK
jgi:hypothetical protein